MTPAIGSARFVACALILFVALAEFSAAQTFTSDVAGGVAVSRTSAETSTVAIAGLDVQTPHADVGAGWIVRGTGGAEWQPLFVMTKAAQESGAVPAYRNGLALSGGFRLARPVANAEVAIAGRAGSAYIDSGDPSLASNGVGTWAAFFEGGVDARWRERLVDVYAGLRHDQRLHRAGDLSSFRDPTGRIVVRICAYPLRHGRFAAGASFEFERAWPGVDRLPSGLSAAVVCRLQISQRG